MNASAKLIEVADFHDELGGTLADLQTMCKKISAHDEYIRTVEELCNRLGVPDQELQAFVSERLASLSRAWIELLKGLQIVGEPSRLDRRYWSQILRAYIEGEISDIGRKSVAANVELYLKLLNVLTHDDHLPRTGKILSICAVNSVLPEQWFNWPSRLDPGKFEAPAWLTSFRTDMEMLIDRIKNSGAPINFERITLVREFEAITHLSLRTINDLRGQKNMGIVAQNDGKPFDVTVFHDTLKPLHRDVPEITDRNGAAAYYIQVDPVNNLGAPHNLLRKFITELHASDQTALYSVLNAGDIAYMTTHSVPLEFVLVGEKETHAAATTWVFAVGARDLEPEKGVALVKLYGMDDVQDLSGWYTRLTANGKAKQLSHL